MYSSGQKNGGYPSGTLYHTSKWKGRPRDFNTINYTKNMLFSAALHPLLQNGAFYLFFFLFFVLLFSANLCFASTIFVLLRSILSEPGDEKICLRGF